MAVSPFDARNNTRRKKRDDVRTEAMKRAAAAQAAGNWQKAAALRGQNEAKAGMIDRSKTSPVQTPPPAPAAPSATPAAQALAKRLANVKVTGNESRERNVLNTTSNARGGGTFERVIRAGRQFHKYADGTTVEVKKRKRGTSK